MNFLNKEKNEARWLTIVLGILLFISYGFAEYASSASLARSMGLLMGVEMNAGYFTMFIIMASGLSYVLFILFVSLAYSIAYRTLVNKTRDVKVMPIAKECFFNHVQFVMIIANIIMGGIGLLLLGSPIEGPVIELVVDFAVKVLAYVIVLFLLCRIGIGSDVKKKIFGGFLTPVAVLVALMI